ncbi:glutamate-1-semialdehyde 2,1-aminomutase [Halocalculus aciditolerans]|uniref:Glutamate-1-semialdehyde 2,1-aminomutase n=1 Tax=Halocalculus aciditolerans TaxID=1383812 RepID=A0A830FEM4_9EURY|nr:glutamate-1-semialdehyde 2,1-aminomutase [Halocalculus aciditolerans]GGL47460.1 aspartate aminotransferase family protein [Halocalculus aciditolerans]
MNRDTSRELYDRALDVLVGGVNSSVRAAPQPYPTFVRKGDAGHVVDADGNKYVDWVMGLGPLLLGHDAPERVTSSVQRRTSEGPMYGMPTEVEVELAEFVTRHVPSVEMLRFVNSGTEATVSAVRLARGYTGRSKVVVMEGGYHGAQESTLVEGDAEHARPSSAGIPQSFAEHTIPVPFNDRAAASEVFEEHGDDIAAVLVEPVMANKGIVEPQDGYHDHLRGLTREHGSLLVFDEVITGFRVGGLACAQGKFDVTPDLTTFGKIVGGGFPVGALGGRTEVMEHLTPVGDVFQAGTFSGHPVTMAAGLQTLTYAAEKDVYDHVNALGDDLRDGLRDIVDDKGLPYSVVGTDSLFKVVFTRDGEPPENTADVGKAAVDRWNRVFRPQMQERGIMLAQNQFESQFVSDAHTQADVDATLDAYDDVL